jgi:hydroxyacylglutathione hydrolase
MYSALEDEFGDVVGKARRGQEIEVKTMASALGLSQDDLGRLETYEWLPDETTCRAIAAYLGLAADKLWASLNKAFFPMYPAGKEGTGLAVKMLVLGDDFLVNGYVIGCQESGKGVVIDPGFEPDKILAAVADSGLDIEQVLLTHGHGDHVSALADVCRALQVPACINPADRSLAGQLSQLIEGDVKEDDQIQVGNQVLTVRITAGHTPGGTSFLHDEMAFVGDALFAGSLGGTRKLSAYKGQQQAVGEQILGLDDRVVLYPGHGPATSVGEEKANNPFFI